MRFPAPLILAALACVMVVDATAGIRQRDFTARSRAFSAEPGEGGSNLQEKRAPVQTNERFETKTIEYSRWDKEMSRLGDQRAPIGPEGTDARSAAQRKSFRHPGVKSYPDEPIERARLDGQEADIRNFDEIREMALVEKYRDASVHRVMENAREFRSMGEELGLKDLNRYQFRKNRPDGIPVQRAGEALQVNEGSRGASVSGGSPVRVAGPRR